MGQSLKKKKKFIFHNKKFFSLLCFCRFFPQWGKIFLSSFFIIPVYFFVWFLVCKYWKIFLWSFQDFSGVFSTFWSFLQTFSSVRSLGFGSSSSPKFLVPF